ncbi:MAG: isoprenylcysteine carboxylmethyltransferase family protein [Ignavibacteriaceae bacterium]|nr:isoprenylcysteine carboxylmethyltransferase family protein [Ignavibacteriaceae bacterium]
MDPINIIILLNIIATFGANFSGAQKGLKTSIIKVKEKPKSYLQTLPTSVAVITLVLLILSLFKIGTFEYSNEILSYRIVGLISYLVFSWVQIWAYKTLGENYSQDVVILNNHKLVKSGLYRFIRHPQYLAQFLVDLTASVAVMSYLIFPIAFVELILLTQRAKLEETLLKKYFKESFDEYKSKSGFMIPFIG